MRYQQSKAALDGFRADIAAIRGKMRDVQAEVEPETVRDYDFTTVDGPVSLSDLFKDSNDLIIIHNMGASCPYCTLWADGFNGVYPHLASRAPFVVCTPDAPKAQWQFANGRGWRFPMVSHMGTSFAADMGYRGDSGRWIPGISVFRKNGNTIFRVSDTGLGPGDDFCSVWHFLDLFPEGRGEWAPRFSHR